MNMFKKTLIASALVAASVAAQAETSINAGVTTDYVWRGISQSGGSASVSGGIDYSSDDSGFYAGTWVGSLGDANGGFNGSELDLYLGYGGDNYDVGYIYYNYAADNCGCDFGEIYGSYSIEAFTLGLAYTVNNGSDLDGGAFVSGDLYYYLSYGGDLTSDWTYGLTLGSYNFDEASDADYVHLGVDFGTSTDAGDFTFSISGTDLDSGDDSEVRAVVSYGVAF